MPRQRRYFVPDFPQHVTARGVNRQAVFFLTEDYDLYLNALKEQAAIQECSIHAYVLMTNHVHLLVTPRHARSLPLLMQGMGRRYVQRLNAHHERTGTLWEGRYRAALVQDNRYLLACHRYIELNPVRAGMVEAPGDYRYSSYAHNALGSRNSLITEHSCYLELHSDPIARLKAYRTLFNDSLSEDLLCRIRKCTNAGSVIGSEKFRQQIEESTGSPVPTGKMGRPKGS
jgi:putative transposase